MPILQMRERSSGEAGDLPKDTQPETASLGLGPRAYPFKFCFSPNIKLVSRAQKGDIVFPFVVSKEGKHMETCLRFPLDSS